MAQSKYTRLDGISFDPENYVGTQIHIDPLTGELRLQDQQVPSVTLSQLVGFENIESVYLVGKQGSGARYKNIQDAINAVPVTSTELNPSVIVVTAGVYNESLVIQKDGLHIVGMGHAVIKGVAGQPTILINDLGVIPRQVTLKNLVIQKDQDGESCVEVSGTLDTTLLQKHLTIQGCSIAAKGIGSYTIKADKANHIKVIDGTWGESRNDSICSISQLASFEMIGVREGTSFQMSYDNTIDAPLVKTSEYSIKGMHKGYDLLVSLLGTGSLAIERSTVGDFSITGDGTLLLSDSQTENLTIQGTTTCSVTSTRYRTISGDATTSLDLSELKGSVDFVATSSMSVSLPLPYPNSLYMVIIEGYDNVQPYVSNKTTTGFDITYPDGLGHTTTVFYQVLR